MVKPVTPKEAGVLKLAEIPDDMIEAVNLLIIRNLDQNGRAVVRQNELKDMMMRRLSQFSVKWLDFEPIFEEAGWKVVYDKPAYNESYEPFFTFTAKGK